MYLVINILKITVTSFMDDPLKIWLQHRTNFILLCISFRHGEYSICFRSGERHNFAIELERIQFSIVWLLFLVHDRNKGEERRNCYKIVNEGDDDDEEENAKFFSKQITFFLTKNYSSEVFFNTRQPCRRNVFVYIFWGKMRIENRQSRRRIRFTTEL